ncbi:hypothetical protein [Geomonas propionica]|uniref:Uncharacterized protein n=1 Tax=Geomonas propionica TaxID=2798582 RepID=A0ABS0YPA1_9BACT|nr:hypothetical protein [Geomonas propionica]MBJ6799746.1 hypothetical protein [Geomonas propionica]
MFARKLPPIPGLVPQNESAFQQENETEDEEGSESESVAPVDEVFAEADDANFSESSLQALVPAPSRRLRPGASNNSREHHSTKKSIALVAKIDSDLHSKLKLYSLFTQQSIVDLVETWIRTSIPEVKVELR